MYVRRFTKCWTKENGATKSLKVMSTIRRLDLFHESMCFAKTPKHPHLYLKAHQHYLDLILFQYLSEYEGYMRRRRKDFTFPSLKEYIETKSGNVKEESIDNVV